MASSRYFCTEHGFVVPTNEPVPMCPYCDHPVVEIRGKPAA